MTTQMLILCSVERHNLAPPPTPVFLKVGEGGCFLIDCVSVFAVVFDRLPCTLFLNFDSS